MSPLFPEPHSATTELCGSATLQASTSSKKVWTASRIFAGRSDNRGLAIADFRFQFEFVAESVRNPHSEIPYVFRLPRAHSPRASAVRPPPRIRAFLRRRLAL